ncbi:putative UDP-glycosyltransferase 84A1 [Hypsibius exemplaris]|uniref:UDP-glucuronosyltransferase n=1 Tax=Hypsibius exemplaris TaxID=2072580 RepID=A0A9X6NH16_HYPEX|nr:putative UDP-glycosyltransferase 84A1 [Hypsibius exemplaris]
MSSNVRKHILLLPFPAYGHVIPLLEFGRKIHRYHDVTLAVSSCIVKDLKQRELISDADFPIVAIPDGFTGFEGFNHQNWVDSQTLALPAIADLLRAIPITQRPSTVSGDDPDDEIPDGERFVWLVNGQSNGMSGHPLCGQSVRGERSLRCLDGRSVANGELCPLQERSTWSLGNDDAPKPLEVCHDRGIPFLYLNTAPASMILGALFVDENYPTIPESDDDILSFIEVPSPEAPLPPMPEAFKTHMLEINRIASMVSGIIVNSVRALEDDMARAIETFPLMKGIPLMFVGPLMPQTEKISAGQLEQQERVEKWLDRREKLSVTYVSFGSIAVPTGEQIAEVAQALLATGKPFIWSLPKAKQHHLPAELTSRISEQFQGEDSRFLILAWAPQKLILQHPATSVFLSHCGWNSSLESLAAGLPVLAWPMFADQKVNAELLVERSTALMVEGTGLKPKRVVPAEEIARLLRRIGGEQTTDTIFRAAAREWKFILDAALAAGGSSEKAFRAVIEFADNT